MKLTKRVNSTNTKAIILDLGNTIQCMEIRKGSTTTLVVLSHEFVIVTDKYLTVSYEPFIKLAKVFNKPQDAYNEWLRIVGKMCTKECTSKYFDKPKISEHLNNGKFPEYLKGTIIRIADAAVKASISPYDTTTF